jgi:Tetratricopeptide repeat
MSNLALTYVAQGRTAEAAALQEEAAALQALLERLQTRT